MINTSNYLRFLMEAGDSLENLLSTRSNHCSWVKLLIEYETLSQKLHDAKDTLFKELKFPMDYVNSLNNLLNERPSSSKEKRSLREVGNSPNKLFIERLSVKTSSSPSKSCSESSK